MAKLLSEAAKREFQMRLFPAAARFIRGGRADLRVKGGQEEMAVIREVLEASRAFYDETRNPDTTVAEVSRKLEEKHDAARKFERIIGVSWPF